MPKAKHIRKIRKKIKPKDSIKKRVVPVIDEELEDEKDEFLDDEDGYISNEKVEQLKEEFKQEALPHISLLHNYAYKMTGNQLDADDLLQETYLRAYRFFHKFEKGTNCKAWLFRIYSSTTIARTKRHPAK